MTQTGVRLDKWLWAARFFKTRSLAKDAIETGKVHYNSARAKPSRTVEIGALIRMKIGWMERTVEIMEISEKRGGAPQAQMLYRETPDSIEKRERLAAERKAQQTTQIAPDHRPTKKERRDIRRVKDQFNP